MWRAPSCAPPSGRPWPSGSLYVKRPDPALALLSAAIAWIALSSLVLFSFFFGTSYRYQFEFVPGLALLASFGVLSLETWPNAGMRVVLRCAWAALLLFSGAFTVLYGIDRCAADHNEYGVQTLMRGNTLAAEHEIETAQLLSPGNPLSRILSGAMLATGGHMSRPASTLRRWSTTSQTMPGPTTGSATCLCHEAMGHGKGTAQDCP